MLAQSLSATVASAATTYEAEESPKTRLVHCPEANPVKAARVATLRVPHMFPNIIG